MSVNQAETLAAIQVLLKEQVPTLLWGDPGTGKTETIERLAKTNNWHIETVLASLHDPTDFGGLPVLSPDGVKFEPPAWAKRVAQHEGHSLVFFDEINTATPATQNALMKVVLSAYVGEFYLGDNVSFLAAANPIHQNAGAWELSLPLSNRFAHLDWPLNFYEFRDGITRGWPDVLPLEGETQDKLSDKYRYLMLGFQNAKSDTLIAPPDADTDDSRGWPSPRSWTRLVRALATARSAGHEEDSNVFMLLAESLIGTSTGIEFLTFLREADLPDPEALLADPSIYVVPKRTDQQMAVLESVVGAFMRDKSVDRWTAAVTICIMTAEQNHVDTAAAAFTTLANHEVRPPGAKPPKGWEKFVELLIAANIPNLEVE